jgi:hypothetical protein
MQSLDLEVPLLADKTYFTRRDEVEVELQLQFYLYNTI